jgi:hypothetical protein
MRSGDAAGSRGSMPIESPTPSSPVGRSIATPSVLGKREHAHSNAAASIKASLAKCAEARPADVIEQVEWICATGLWIVQRFAHDMPRVVSMHFNTLVARVATGDARTASILAALVSMSFYALTRHEIERRHWPMRRSDVRSDTYSSRDCGVIGEMRCDSRSASWSSQRLQSRRAYFPLWEPSIARARSGPRCIA